MAQIEDLDLSASENYVDLLRGETERFMGVTQDQVQRVTNALALKADLSNGKVPAAQLPAFVDDVIECADMGAFPEVGENGKLYLATDTNKVYRWSGSQYIEVSNSLALGETSGSAFPGDRGKAAEEAILAETARAEDAEQRLAGNINSVVNIAQETFFRKQDKLVAGDNIVIAGDGKTISATDEFEVWNGTIDSLDGVTDNMVGIAPLADGSYPRLHARNKEIHGCKGFSNETGNYTGQELLLPWDVAMSNETSYLMAATLFESNRGMGGNTPFIQPLLPGGRIPNFEYSPLYWIGHILYNDAQDPSQSAVKQVTIPWNKIAAGETDTIALASDLEKIGGGSVYDVVAVASNVIPLDPSKKYYVVELNGTSTTFTITPPTDITAEQVIVFRLLCKCSAMTEVVLSNVTMIDGAPSYSGGSECLLELVSYDTGETWYGRVLFESTLPYKRQVKSLRGDQYASCVDTGICLSSSHEVELYAGVKQYASMYREIFGLTGNDETCKYYAQFASGDDARMSIQLGTPTTKTPIGIGDMEAIPLSRIHFSPITNGMTVSYTLNGTEYAANFTGDDRVFDAPADATKTAYYGRANGGMTNATNRIIILGELKISLEGTMLQHLIPVEDNDGVYCFYDKIGKVFHYPMGGTTFSLEEA